jgi:cullin 1
LVQFALILVTLGIDSSDFKKTSLTLYIDSFEKPFLDETEKVYKEDSQTYITINPVTEYLKKAESWLAEEEDRVRHYLHSSTHKPLVALAEVTLLTNHARIIQDQFKPLLEREKLDDLRRLYSLFSRVPDNLAVLRDTFEAHVKGEGILVLQKLISGLNTRQSSVGESSSTPTAEESRASVGEDREKKSETDPKLYADALLQVFTKFNIICTNIFQAEAGFSASLDKACREFVNRNPYCPDGSSKSSELLAKHCDSLLRKSSKNNEDSEMENLLNGIV